MVNPPALTLHHPRPTIGGCVAAAPPREASSSHLGSPPFLLRCRPVPALSSFLPSSLPHPAVIRIHFSTDGRREGGLREIRSSFTCFWLLRFPRRTSASPASPASGRLRLRLREYRWGCLWYPFVFPRFSHCAQRERDGPQIVFLIFYSSFFKRNK